MKILYERDLNCLNIGGIPYTVTNSVRNEIDPVNVRRLHDPKEVVFTVTKDRTKGKPYMPRKFPIGMWEITGIENQRDFGFNPHEYGLVRIRTNATQKVETWALDDKGGYDKPTGIFVDDYGYLFHYSESRTTLGCGRIDKQENALSIAAILSNELKKGKVFLEVV